MAPGPDPRFRPWLPSVMKYDLRVVSWNQPFPSQVSLWCLSQWLRHQDVLSPKFGDIQSLKDSNSCFYSDPGISSENSLWFCVCLRVDMRIKWNNICKTATRIHQNTSQNGLLLNSDVIEEIHPRGHLSQAHAYSGASWQKISLSGKVAKIILEISSHEKWGGYFLSFLRWIREGCGFSKTIAKLNFKQRMQYQVKEQGNGMNKEDVDRGSVKNVYRV